ncbi:MAG: hypothetical protein JWP27_2380 [Flaviaesturariibacter sp.]|nr:hypothetical protein [Flaviaesturariibacter sp.]
MKPVLALLLLLSCGIAHAQATRFPVLPASGRTVAAFVPKRWFIKDSATGDLNRDGLADKAIVIESRDSINELRPDSTINNGSPRILVVLLKNSSTGRYDKLLQNNTFIVRWGEGGMDPEAYGGTTIEKGVLKTRVSFLRQQLAYTFRYQHGDLYLIGGRSTGVSGGIIDGFDANFSTGRARVSQMLMDDEKEYVEWIKLPKKSLKKLRNMRMILEWEVMKGKLL